MENKDWVIEQVGAYAYVKKLKELLDLLAKNRRLGLPKDSVLTEMEDEIIETLARDIDGAKRRFMKHCAKCKNWECDKPCYMETCLEYSPIEGLVNYPKTETVWRDKDGKVIKVE